MNLPWYRAVNGKSFQVAIVKNIFRNIIFPAVVGLGMEKLMFFSSEKRRLVLCYHGCNQEPDFKLNGRHMQVNQFEKHLLYYKKNFNIVSLSEIFRSYRQNVILDRKTLALTFDDGYLNNYTQVFPLLKKYNVPATFFIVSSSLIDGNYILWPDIIDIVRSYSGINVLDLNGTEFEAKPGIGYYSDRLKISLSDHIKKMGLEKQTFLDELILKTNFHELLKRVPVENYRFINAGQLKFMSESNLVEIGSHSHSHYNLGNINPELVEEELAKSKKILEEAIGKEVRSIAFPDGSYNEHVKKACVLAGYSDQVAVGYQCADDSADKNIISRLTISNTTTFESNMIQVNLGFKKRGF